MSKRQYPRTAMKCRIKISHPSFGEVLGQTRDLSDGGVYVRHPELAALGVGDVVTGQVQDLPIEAPAPVLEMEVMRVDAEGVGLRFVNCE
ncbi:PilZ domain-containing protein [Stutzerimonas azotifigens]|uniref:PilZ domain-containing protein n=1 Tax=Stutzerimonas azotifigens TaxID=291995 RepID=A0ABR5Z677_9GAMM|nr:PilZ domain-containing protein [Stutzerimonas azotifigens]MBA1275655.1 PilZ domain-containing protein [Stutzerimonas azotifigens]